MAYLKESAERVEGLLVGIASDLYQLETRPDDLISDLLNLLAGLREGHGVSREIQATLERTWHRYAAHKEKP